MKMEQTVFRNVGI